MHITEKIALAFIIPAASVLSVFVTPEINILLKYFSLNISSAGDFMSYYLAGYLSGQILFSYLSKKYGYKKPIQYGFAIALAGIFIQIYGFEIKSPTAFLASRFFIALGLSSGLVCGFAYLKSTLSGREEKKFLSIITVIFTFSIYISICLSGNLIKSHKISIIFLINIGYIILLLLLTLILRDRKNSNIGHINANNKMKNTKNYVKSYLKTIVYSLTLSITTIFAYCYSTYAPIFLMKNQGLTPAIYSNVNFINLFAVLLGSYMFNILSKRVFEHQLIIYSMFMLLIGSFFYSMISDNINFYALLSFLILSFFLNILCGLIYPAATYKCLESGNCKSTASGIMNTIKIGAPTLALIVSHNYSNQALSNLSFAMLIFSLLNLVLLLLVTQRGRTLITHFVVLFAAK